MTTTLRHGRIRLALHTLRAGDGPALLLLHGLGERSPGQVPGRVAAWRGSIHALDFTGHGESTLPRGGGYTAEQLMGDADAALAHLGRATLLGRGLGAYVALLLAGARTTDVAGAILCDGPGLAGAGESPGTPTLRHPDPNAKPPPDPLALVELAGDLRPADYASSFARQATQLSALERPLVVAARERPPWLSAIVAEPGVEELEVGAGLALYSR